MSHAMNAENFIPAGVDPSNTDIAASRVSLEELPDSFFWQEEDFRQSSPSADESGQTDREPITTNNTRREFTTTLFSNDEFPMFPGATREGIEAMREPHGRATERSELIRFGTALTAGGLAVTAMFSTLYVVKPVADMLRESTPTEKYIEDTLEATYGNRPIFRCLSQADLDVRPSGLMPIAYDKSGKGWIVGLPLAWAHEQACENFVGFAEDPISYEEAMRDPNAKEKLEAAVSGASTVVHEYKHTAHPDPTSNESDTECFAVSQVHKFLQAAGGEGTEEFKRLVTDMALESAEEAAEKHPEYTLKPTCSPLA